MLGPLILLFGPAIIRFVRIFLRIEFRAGAFDSLVWTGKKSFCAHFSEDRVSW